MTELSIDQFSEYASRIETEVGKVIVGQVEVVRHVLVSILAGGHVLLEGVPGLGKTMLIRTLGEALDLKFSRIQFTPDLMPADILGTEILTDQDGRREFRFRPGPLFANLVLADEPTGNLDTHTGDALFNLMRTLNRGRGISFVIVTHNEKLSAQADRIIHMEDGQIVQP